MKSRTVDVVCLGEIMLRLSPPRYKRLRTTDKFDVHPCGAQFNVAANLALLGKKSIFLTRLPENELGYLARWFGESFGVDMSYIKFAGNTRIGLVFLEFSMAPRRGMHLYDRKDSAASLITPDDYDWESILENTRFAHLDGIFPAISNSCYQSALRYLHAARNCGCMISFDVNYRQSLWNESEARNALSEMLSYVNILVTNRTISEELLGISGSDLDIMRAYQLRFGCDFVCLTYKDLRGYESGSWRSIALFGDTVYESNTFNFKVIDPYGSGDAFMAGLLYGFMESMDPLHALNFGGAMCAISHTIEGDQVIISSSEVEALLQENYSLIIRR